MTSIKEEFDKLTSKDKALLNYAFEHSISQFIKIDEGKRFVGVNTGKVKNLRPTAISGDWAVGEILNENNSTGS